MAAELEKSPSTSTSRDEKADDIERGAITTLTAQCHDPDANLSDAEKAKVDRELVSHLDSKLIPWLCWLYLLAFLDRTNIGNAKISGLDEDLELDVTMFNASLTIFFVAYAVFEPVTNVLLKKWRPSIFIPAIMILWGISMMTMGFVKNWSGLMATRFFLGMTEAGLFPGVNYYLSCWYKRSELGIRAAIFFSAAAIAGSFGGCLAAGIEQMDGIGNLAGWAWIFVLEGLLTVIFGILSFWMVHDFPDEATFLSDQDRARVIRRLQLDQQHSACHEDFQWEYLWQAVKDSKTWLGMLIYMGCDMPLYAFSIFLPSIIEDLGFHTPDEDGTVYVSQLMTVPPYVLGAIATILVGWLADKYRNRGLLNIGCSIVGIVGFVLILASESPRVKYTGTFLAALGIYPCISNTITWVANNVEGVYKRGVVLGVVIGWGNLNGVASSNVYASESNFKTGHIVVLAYLCLLCLTSIIQTIYLAHENKCRLRGDRDNWIEGKTPEEIEMLGDKRPDFMYTL